MTRMLRNKDVWLQISKPLLFRPNNRLLCTSTSNSKNVGDGSSSSVSKYDPYKDLENLDFKKATRILFSEPTRKKKFGIDFHVVQFFIACMPSLAVYLVALYARHEMRRMEAELELKKKAEEEAKAKEMELKAAEEKEAASSDPELVDVKVRLAKLEEALEEIVVESKKQSGRSISKNNEDGSEKKHPSTTAQRDTETRNSPTEGHHGKQT